MAPVSVLEISREYCVKYEVCLESIQPYNMKNRHIYWRRYKIQETLYIGQWCLSPLQSRHLGTSHSSPNHHPLPYHIFLLSYLLSYFPESHQWSEISSLSKVILVLGKARSHRVPNLGCGGAESPGWFDVLQNTVHEMSCMSGHVVMMKLPITSCPWSWPCESAE